MRIHLQLTSANSLRATVTPLRASQPLSKPKRVPRDSRSKVTKVLNRKLWSISSIRVLAKGELFCKRSSAKLTQSKRCPTRALDAWGIFKSVILCCRTYQTLCYMILLNMSTRQRCVTGHMRNGPAWVNDASSTTLSSIFGNSNSFLLKYSTIGKAVPFVPHVSHLCFYSLI